MKHASIDLETLGKTATAAFTQIGVTLFDPQMGEIGETVKICCAPYPGGIEPDTVAWWLKQDSEPRMQMALSMEDECPERHALQALSDFLCKNDVEFVWGNGATFDITILESGYCRNNMPKPWQFWGIRDMRTIVHLAEELKHFRKDDIERDGTHHDAGADSRHQAKVIAAAWKALV